MAILDELYDQADELTYGATFDDVKPLLPHRRWTQGSKPDAGDVGGFIRSVASILDVPIGDLLADPLPISVPVANRLVALAKRATVYGAAAQAEAAGSPERARPNEASSYAEWLLDRYREAVDEVEAFATGLLGGEIPGTELAAQAEPAWAFPDPVGWAARGI